MPISRSALRSVAGRYAVPSVRSLTEAKKLGLITAFLCHSHRDIDLVKGLVVTLHEAGWNVYVDWADPRMPDTPNRETAQRIREKIVSADFFIFLLNLLIFSLIISL